MLNKSSWRLMIAVTAAAVLIVAAGGAAIASNMGFKINYAYAQAFSYCSICQGGPTPGANCQLGSTTCGAGGVCTNGTTSCLTNASCGTGGFCNGTNKGKNDISLPFNNPYTLNCTTGGPCVGAFCQALALPGGIGGTVVTDLITAATVPPSGNFNNTTCPTATATTGASFGVPLVPGKFVRVRAPLTFNPGSLIIVGSHNPTTSLDIRRVGATGFVHKTWFGPPYHTTAVTTTDICLQTGLKRTLPAATITTLDPFTGVFSNAACSATSGSPLSLGRGIQLTQPNVTGAVDLNFIPAHF